jgi:hypothetical protein
MYNKYDENLPVVSPDFSDQMLIESTKVGKDLNDISKPEKLKCGPNLTRKCHLTVAKKARHVPGFPFR